jgi:hypothetical protein
MLLDMGFDLTVFNLAMFSAYRWEPTLHAPPSVGVAYRKLLSRLHPILQYGTQHYLCPV